MKIYEVSRFGLDVREREAVGETEKTYTFKTSVGQRRESKTSQYSTFFKERIHALDHLIERERRREQSSLEAAQGYAKNVNALLSERLKWLSGEAP